MELYIVRHGETLWNREKRLQGREDIELSENGRKVARLTSSSSQNCMYLPTMLRHFHI